MKKLIVVMCTLLASSYAFAGAGSSATLHIKGEITSVCELGVFAAAALHSGSEKVAVDFQNLESAESIEVGTLQIHCNKADGFNVEIASAGGGRGMVGRVADDLAAQELAASEGYKVMPYKMVIEDSAQGEDVAHGLTALTQGGVFNIGGTFGSGEKGDLQAPAKLYVVDRLSGEDSIDGQGGTFDMDRKLTISHEAAPVGWLSAGVYMDEVTFTILPN